MQTLKKVGYVLLGVGLGGLIATVIYERELNKPIGDVEEYIPKEDAENKVVGNAEGDVDAEADYNPIADLYRTSSSNEFDSQSSIDMGSTAVRRENSHRTLYSKMYKLNVDKDGDLAYTEDSLIDDIPSDDEVYDDDMDISDDELVRERVENNFEIYLGENPQDFVTLIFYQGDSTVTDDQEQLVPNPEDVVGHVAISRLIEGGPGAEEGVIYVRNLKTMINYEIVLDAGSYKDTVLGIFNSRSNNGADRYGDTR